MNRNSYLSLTSPEGKTISKTIFEVIRNFSPNFSSLKLKVLIKLDDQTESAKI